LQKKIVELCRKHGKILLEILSVYIFMNCVLLLSNGGLRYSGKGIVLSSLIVVLCSFCFMELKRYYAVLFVMSGFFFSPFWIKLLAGESLLRNEVLIYSRTAFAISGMLVLLLACLNCCRQRALRFLAKLVVVFIIALPLLTLWGNFFTSGSFMGADAFAALAQTNPDEAREYLQQFLSWQGVMALACLLFLLIFMVCLSESLHLRLDSRKLLALLLISLLANGYVVYKTRINLVTNIAIRGMQNLSKYTSFKKSQAERKKNIRLAQKGNMGSDGIYVLVIGESENRDNMSAYGYARKTTPWLEKMREQDNFLLFKQAYSCHTHTVPVLSYALTAKNQYNKLELKHAPSIVEVAEAAGYEVAWLSNQVPYSAWDTPTTVIAKEAQQQSWINHNIGETTATNYYDEKLWESLRRVKPAAKMLIVLHLMGNHGSYRERYPRAFSKFGEKKSLDLYDNSILYNDYVLQGIYEEASKLPHFKGMIYLSDHADAVVAGLGHDSSRFVPSMSHIPLYMVFSQEYIEENSEKFTVLKQAREKVFTNDLLFNTVLSVMNIRLEGLYEAENDLASPSYNADPARFRTLYGKKSVGE
jgi:heptose-I-phosphate ethanolaminephosphotransferase